MADDAGAGGRRGHEKTAVQAKLAAGEEDLAVHRAHLVRAHEPWQGRYLPRYVQSPVQPTTEVMAPEPSKMGIMQ